LVREGGGTMQSEEAVQRGLAWLVKHQDPRTGGWSNDAFTLAGRCTCGDPGEKHDIAATAFGLLPILAAGNTHLDGRYAKNVKAGIEYLLSKQDKKAGNFEGNAYENALATIAVCEDYGMTRAPALRGPAQAAIDYIVRAQHETGSWGYSAGTKGDTSVSGFQFQALKTGFYAGLRVSEVSFVGLGRHLDMVRTPDGLGYGYSTPSYSPVMSAVALLCREYTGWVPEQSSVSGPVDYLFENNRNFSTGNRPSFYFLLYASQVFHHYGGEKWEVWNQKVRDYLVESQDKGDRGVSHQAGSWSPVGDTYAKQGGRLMATSFALLTLEVYYGNIPLYW
jgi:hypothetical protein